MTETWMMKKSKTISYLLRHHPEDAHLTMDAHGWVGVDELIQNLELYQNIIISRKELDEIVATNDKKRFAFSDDGLKIRASQGHSIQIDLGLKPSTPPDILYHGTADRFLDTIKKEGLLAMSRQQVHLSSTKEIATSVGARHGRPVILFIESGKMNAEGYLFYISENGVWLTDHVPPQFIKETL